MPLPIVRSLVTEEPNGHVDRAAPEAVVIVEALGWRGSGRTDVRRLISSTTVLKIKARKSNLAQLLIEPLPLFQAMDPLSCLLR